MTRDQQIELIRQRCIAANPEIESVELIANGYPGETLSLVRTIRLADVCRALEHRAIIYGDLPIEMQLSNIEKLYGEVVSHWALGKPDHLTNQDDPCILFIYDLLK